MTIQTFQIKYYHQTFITSAHTVSLYKIKIVVCFHETLKTTKELLYD